MFLGVWDSIIMDGRMNPALVSMVNVGGMNSALQFWFVIFVCLSCYCAIDYFLRLSRINMAFELVLPTCLSSLSKSLLAATSSPNLA